MRELPNGTKVRVTLTGEPSARCPICNAPVKVTKTGRVGTHGPWGKSGKCSGSGQKIEREK
jgi:hypothetical protein